MKKEEKELLEKAIKSNQEMMTALAKFSELFTLLIEGDHDMDLQLEIPPVGKPGTGIDLYV